MPVSPHAAKIVDELPVGRLISILKRQGCRDYTPLDVSGDRLHRDLREHTVRREANRGEEFTSEVKHFWSALRKELREERRRSRSRSRSRRKKKRSRSRGRQEYAVPAKGHGKGSSDKDKNDEEYDPFIEEVERFIERTGIDHSASDFLRSQKPYVKKFVMQRGHAWGWQQAKNPSSALMRVIMESQRLATPMQYKPTTTGTILSMSSTTTTETSEAVAKPAAPASEPVGVSRLAAARMKREMEAKAAPKAAAPAPPKAARPAPAEPVAAAASSAPAPSRQEKPEDMDDAMAWLEQVAKGM
eukprot:TRINITY_DN3011_c0_g1_i1.p1 TRINITY_DN3011_c0_g1~~TRINITY_DN3011_c0_g1_i1.p1  ORF type:complete len:301 (+),score=60.99 TRINITY_DN3011_c0_g1_i1:131-1033(+)